MYGGVHGEIQVECVLIFGPLYTLCVITVKWYSYHWVYKHLEVPDLKSQKFRIRVQHIFSLYEFCTTPGVYTRVKPPSHVVNYKSCMNKKGENTETRTKQGKE